MGRSTTTSRQAVEALCSRIASSKDSMRKEDLQVLEELMIMGRKHAGELSAGDIEAELRFVISILMEIIKLLDRG
jgi:hypothetical protein